MTTLPVTLGDLLTSYQETDSKRKLRNFVLRAAFIITNVVLLTVLFILGLAWIAPPAGSNYDDSNISTLILIAGWGWLIANAGLYGLRRVPRLHPLLANDQQNFMRDLRLDKKTVIFDGSNIYHFGRENGLDAQPLGMLAHALRQEGYRTICFFDANIFFTLTEHGGMAGQDRHSIAVLMDIFGLAKDEIYVVPSGVQADRYILESLKYLPISFAVTNDRFRDYATLYPTVMNGNQWRKGVVLSNGEIKLLQYQFRVALRVGEIVK